MTALIQGRTNKALTAQDPRSTKPLGQEVEVTQAIEKRQDRCLRTDRRRKSVHGALEVVSLAAHQHQIVGSLDLLADDGAHDKVGRTLIRHANCKAILSNLFGASRTYQEGYVTSGLQQLTTEITTDSAGTNDEYSHLRFSDILVRNRFRELGLRYATRAEAIRCCWRKSDSMVKRASGPEAAASMIVRMSLDFAECDQARLARDPAYDGRFYTGVRSTGIYCRPVCPVRPARSANVSFFPSAAAAEAAGFRPCLRCRPETAPFCSAWIGSRATVERALRLIAEEGALDQEGATVERLAQRLGMGSRQLARLFARHLQASPSQAARTARVQRAKRLLDETGLPMTEIAMRAGFGSLRRFNSVFAEVYRRPPTEIRRARRLAGKEEQAVEDIANENSPTL